MSSYKFTKGPWHVLLSDNATPFVMHSQGEDGSDYEDLTSRICVMPAEIMHSYNSYQNARLIAKAPELVQALEEVVINYFNPDGMFKACQKASALLAELKGT